MRIQARNDIIIRHTSTYIFIGNRTRKSLQDSTFFSSLIWLISLLDAVKCGCTQTFCNEQLNVHILPGLGVWIKVPSNCLEEEGIWEKRPGPNSGPVNWTGHVWLDRKGMTQSISWMIGGRNKNLCWRPISFFVTRNWSNNNNELENLKNTMA